jgi:hypothetical protein
MSTAAVKSPGKGDDRDAEEGTASSGILPLMASETSISSNVSGRFSVVPELPAPATFVLAAAFTTLGGLEDGVDVFGVHVRVDAAYVLEDRIGRVKEGCRIAFIPSKKSRCALFVKADII